jgi:hypothetical protein
MLAAICAMLTEIPVRGRLRSRLTLKPMRPVFRDHTRAAKRKTIPDSEIRPLRIAEE